MAKRLTLTNDTSGVKNVEQVYTYGQDGNHTAVTGAPVFAAKEAGTITGVYLTTAAMTTSTDRTLSADVKKLTGTTAAASVCSTNPAFAATATGAGVKTTVNSGTGITQAVIKTDGTQRCAAGDIVTVDLAIAGSNGTVGANTAVTVVFVPDTV